MDRHFFGTLSDLRKGIEIIESKINLTYSVYGLFDTAEVESYNSLFLFEYLGVHPTGNHVSGFRFLVTKKETPLNITAVMN